MFFCGEFMGKKLFIFCMSQLCYLCNLNNININMNLKSIIKTYQESGDFTHGQKIYFFLKPSSETLDMIARSPDPNFRKACISAVIDYNTNLGDYEEFFDRDIVKETLLICID
jgi:hypothetical protein